MVSIVHVTTSLNLGGAERFVVDLAAIQREFFIDASIVSLGEHDDILVEEAERNNIPLKIHPSSRGKLRVYAPLYRLFQVADVIQIHSPYALKYVLPVLLLLSSKKIIYTRHGEGLTEVRWKIFHRLVEKIVDLVTFVSVSAHESFKLRHDWAFSKLRVIENGVYVPDVVTREKMYPVRFGSVGRMAEVKGQRYLLAAWDKIAMPESDASPVAQQHVFELHFFGSGPLENQLKEQATGNANAELIFFHGAIIDREKIYSSIDVLVVSSESEGLSLVILEAMARGIPVIATAVGGNVCLVQQDVSGYLVHYGDSDSMLNALMRFIDNPEIISDLGQRARQLVAEHYSIKRTHEAYLKCYHDVLGGPIAL